MIDRKLDMLKTIVSRVTGVADITIECRKKHVVEAKALYTYAALADSDIKKGAGPTEIARRLNLNHASVIYYTKQKDKFFRDNPLLPNKYSAIVQQLFSPEALLEHLEGELVQVEKKKLEIEKEIQLLKGEGPSQMIQS